MLHRQLRHRNKCACSCGQHGQADVHVRHEAAPSLGWTLPLQDRAQQRHIGRLHVGNGVAVLQCRYDADSCDACNRVRFTGYDSGVRRQLHQQRDAERHVRADCEPQQARCNDWQQGCSLRLLHDVRIQCVASAGLHA